MAAGRSEHLESAVAAFVGGRSQVSGIDSLGDGNINDTYLVTRTAGPSLVLQRINSSVFPDPKGVAANAAALARHLSREDAGAGNRGYRFPRTVAARDGLDWHQDRDGEIWRCQTFIEGTVSHQRVVNSGQARDAGRLLGSFHMMLAGLDHRELGAPLPGFHDLNRYRQAYIEAVRVHRRGASPRLDYCRSMAERGLEDAALDELAEAEGVGERIIHGDPKCDNFLFDADTNRAVSLIDLDTTAPGLAAADLGDCLRSFCNPRGEKDDASVCFDITTCRELIVGYQSVCITTAAENRLIYHGVRLMAYELGLRFLTDYLDNNRYFKAADDRENLLRAYVQFRLLESIEEQRRDIEAAAGC